MNALDRELYGSIASVTPTSDQQEQAQHAASPNDFTFKTSAGTIVLALIGFYAVIYILHVAERVVRK